MCSAASSDDYVFEHTDYSRFTLKLAFRVASPRHFPSPGMVWQRSKLWLSASRRWKTLVDTGVVRRRRSGDDSMGSDSENESGYQTCPLYDHA